MQNTQTSTKTGEGVPPESVATAKPVTPTEVVKVAAKKSVKPVFTVAKKAPARKNVTVDTTVAKPKVSAQPASKVASRKAASVNPQSSETPVAKEKAPAVAKVIAAKPAKAKPQNTPKDVKEKKVKLVRDSIAIPKSEYVVLGELKLRAAKLACEAKKTEIIRAGIKALAAMSDRDFLASIKAVPNLKTGRPVKGS